jgi:hypothetical protein
MKLVHVRRVRPVHIEKWYVNNLNIDVAGEEKVKFFTSESIKLNKLKRHLETMNAEYIPKTP